MKYYSIKYKKTDVYFTDSGKGPAIVLLHGFLGSSEIWKDFIKDLSLDYRVVAVDLPGHGKTGNIAIVHSMEMIAETVKAVLNHLKIKKCTMVGHSMGGSVTLAFAELFPFMLNGFGLVHSTAYDDTPEGKKNRDKMVETVRKDRLKFIISFIPNLFPNNDVEKFSVKIKLLQKIASTMSKESVIASLEGMKIRRNRIDVIRNSKVPMLFVIGKKDPRLPFEKVLPQLAECNNGYVTILGNAGHMGFIEAPKEVLHSIRALLRIVK